jgi:hypothetical protein
VVRGAVGIGEVAELQDRLGSICGDQIGGLLRVEIDIGDITAAATRAVVAAGGGDGGLGRGRRPRGSAGSGDRREEDRNSDDRPHPAFRGHPFHARASSVRAEPARSATRSAHGVDLSPLSADPVTTGRLT